jgi:hypothetical protein
MKTRTPGSSLQVGEVGWALAGSWLLGVIVKNKKKKKKNVYIEKTRTYGPKRHICRRLGPISSLQPIQTLFVIVKHKQNLNRNRNS